MLSTLIFFFHLIVYVKTQPKHCYADANKQYKYFSTKTSYEVSRNKNMHLYQNCTPVYIWGLIRHGTRYNSAKQINHMKKLLLLRDAIILNHQQNRGYLCNKDLKNLENWTYTLNESLGSELTEQGRIEQSAFAKRLKTFFPDLLSQSKDVFDIQTSETNRTKHSALAFTNALFNTNYDIIYGNNIKINSELLHLNKFCPGYNYENLMNPLLRREYNLFLKGSHVNNMITDISARLGFLKPLKFADIELIYQSCALENAWYLNSKPAFCAAFSEEDLKLLEYSEDLKNYWSKGYGNPLQKKLGCSLLKSMLTNLIKSMKNQTLNKASFYFTHSEMILPLVVNLDLNHDGTPLQHDNYKKLKETRKWKLALFDSFNGNIMAVLHKCKKKYHVIFYQNEYEIILPGCENSFCSIEDLNNIFVDIIKQFKCDSKFCTHSEYLIQKSMGVMISNSFHLVFISFVITNIFQNKFF